MKLHDDIDEATAALIDKNLDLVHRFLQELFNDPAKIEQMPSGATVFVVPADEPDFGDQQSARAERSARAGKNAYLWRLDAPPGEPAATEVRVEDPAPAIGRD